MCILIISFSTASLDLGKRSAGKTLLLSPSSLQKACGDAGDATLPSPVQEALAGGRTVFI